MQGIVFQGDRKLELREFPDPTPGKDDVVLEIKASGMCGSDLMAYRAGADAIDRDKQGEPFIAGHEPCGVVVAKGSNVTDLLPLRAAGSCLITISAAGCVAIV